MFCHLLSLETIKHHNTKKDSKVRFVYGQPMCRHAAFDQSWDLGTLSWVPNDENEMSSSYESLSKKSKMQPLNFPNTGFSQNAFRPNGNLFQMSLLVQFQTLPIYPEAHYFSS